jgi:hypothetical protein
LLRTVAAPAAGGISRSLRFNSADSAYLSRTPASAGNRKIWTWAGWVKRSALGSAQTIFAAVQNGNNGTVLQFTANNEIQFFNYVGGAYAGRRITTAVYRDPSAWYHIVLAWDSANGTTANRVRLYVNGVEVTVFGTTGDPSSSDSILNSTNAHYIGADVGFNNQYSNQYLADIYFIDGQALTPSSFTETDATTGQLIPKAFSGSYGSQGWHLEFADNSSNTATTLGKDTSGNGNNWTPNNLSVTAGAGNDSLVDTPTSYGTNTGAGGEVRGNYATLNPLAKFSTGGVTTSNGNLTAVLDRTTYNNWIPATFAMPASGKYYFEVVQTAATGSTTPQADVGLMNILTPINQQVPTNYRVVRLATGEKVSEAGSVSYGTGFVLNDVCQVAIDMDAGKIWFGKNGSWFASGDPATGANAAYTDIVSSGYGWLPAILNIRGNNTNTVTANFGQRAFSYTAPTNYRPLVDTLLPAPLVTKPNTVFDTVLWTGNDTGQTITMPGAFSPDLVWTKTRSTANAHWLFDVIRGTNQGLSSSSTTNELTRSSSVTAFGSTGFTLGTSADVNSSAYTYVAWAWDAGSSTDTNNTAGTITPTGVRANATAGFSIVTYTGTGANATVGHGLGVAPQMIIVKTRSAGNSWKIYHSGLTSAAYNLEFTTGAQLNEPQSWNSTAPTSTVFSVGTQNSTNQSGATQVAYCFAPVVGYSSFGSYTGNGSSDGPFVYTGFRPRWVLVKRTSSTGNWNLFDTSRSDSNLVNKYLLPNDPGGEFTFSFGDILSNGFKLRDTSADWNASGSTYVYAAFAESPFNYARAR